MFIIHETFESNHKSCKDHGILLWKWAQTESRKHAKNVNDRTKHKPSSSDQLWNKADFNRKTIRVSTRYYAVKIGVDNSESSSYQKIMDKFGTDIISDKYIQNGQSVQGQDPYS